MTLGKSSALIAIKRDISLAIAYRSHNDPANNASGSHALAPVATARPKSSRIMNKYERSVMTAPRNKELKIGSPTLPTNRMTSKNSSCSRCWEPMDRIFKVLEPDGLGESYSL